MGGFRQQPGKPGSRVRVLRNHRCQQKREYFWLQVLAAIIGVHGCRISCRLTKVIAAAILAARKLASCDPIEGASFDHRNPRFREVARTVDEGN